MNFEQELGSVVAYSMMLKRAEAGEEEKEQTKHKPRSRAGVLGPLLGALGGAAAGSLAGPLLRRISNKSPYITFDDAWKLFQLKKPPWAVKN